MADAVRFDDDGLVPCVAQDFHSGEVLTLAYMDAEALRLTRETGEIHFFSRSRGRLWKKGESSGNVQRVRQIRYDCDGDALVALVEPAGPACHTGERSCFYRDLDGSAEPVVDGPAVAGEPLPAAHEALAVLERTVRARHDHRPEGSYTAELLADSALIGDKVREEADEVARAAAGNRTSGSPRRRPTCSITSRCCWCRATCRSQPPWRSSMAVVGAESGPAIEPGLDRARELAGEANVIPVSYRFVDDCETPVSAFLKLREAFGGSSFLLESAEQGRLGRYSFLGFRPRIELRWAEGTLTRVRDGELVTSSIADPYAAVAETLAGFTVAEPERLPPFAGGAVGFFGYDLVRTVEPLGPPNADPLGLPDLALMVCELMLAFDHLKHEVTVLGYAFCDRGGSRSKPPTTMRSRSSTRPGRSSAARCPPPGRGPRSRAPSRPGLVQARTDRGSLDVEPQPRAVRGQRGPDRRVHARRRRLPGGPLAAVHGAGDGRGVLDLPRPAHGQPFAIHVLPRLRRVPGRRRLAGAPRQGERPPRRDPADRGHLPARGNAEEDRAQAEALLDDPKERAEHVMLVDLGRNDLGRVCEYGSVSVDEYMVVETYSHVFHIVSQVSGRLREGVSAMDVLRATLPAGTLSGAPKVRAMQIIDELEPHKRCSYGGAIGYLSFTGDLDTAIHIRTAVVKDGRVHVQAGGGTVADAEPAYEYVESVNKAKAMFDAVALAEAQPEWG